MDELSMLAMATGIIPKDATCRACRYRTKFYYDNPIKVKHCCQKQLSNRRNLLFGISSEVAEGRKGYSY